MVSTEFLHISLLKMHACKRESLNRFTTLFSIVISIARDLPKVGKWTQRKSCWSANKGSYIFSELSFTHFHCSFIQIRFSFLIYERFCLLPGLRDFLKQLEKVNNSIVVSTFDPASSYDETIDEIYTNQCALSKRLSKEFNKTVLLWPCQGMRVSILQALILYPSMLCL